MGKAGKVNADIKHFSGRWKSWISHNSDNYKLISLLRCDTTIILFSITKAVTFQISKHAVSQPQVFNS